MFGAALVAAAASYAAHVAGAGMHPVLAALLVTAVFASVYFAAARVLGLAEAHAFIDALARRVRARNDGPMGR